MSTTTGTRHNLYLPGRHCWTREEFERIADSGVFGPEARLELIEGEIIVKEPPLKASHASGVSLSEEEARRAFPSGYYVRNQLPLALGGRNEPLPDIAVVVGSARDYEEEHPVTAVLIIEVADTTLRYDRTTKASLYARAGIQDYWILNLLDRQLEVHRQPIPMRGRPLGYAYADITQYDENQTVSPLAAPGVIIAVADLLPRRV